MNFKITESESPMLDEAKSILKRIQRRDLYPCIGEIDLTCQEELKGMSKAQLLEDIGRFYSPENKMDLTILRQRIVPGMKLEKVTRT